MDKFAAHNEIRKHEAFACTMVWKLGKHESRDKHLRLVFTFYLGTILLTD